MPHIGPRSSFYNLAGIQSTPLNDSKYFSQEFVCPVPQVIFKYRKIREKRRKQKRKEKRTQEHKTEEPIPGHISLRTVVSCMTVKGRRQRSRTRKAVGAQSSVSVAYFPHGLFVLLYYLTESALMEYTLKRPLLVCESLSHHYLLL